MNISEIKNQLRKSQPVPIKMLRLLDEADESDECESETEQKPSDKELHEVDHAKNMTINSDNEKNITDVKKSDTKMTDMPLIENNQGNHVTFFPETATKDNLIEKDKCDSSRKSLSLTAKTSMNKVIETPIKHTPCTSKRPIPCLSHRNIFQTPECPQMSIESSSKAVQSVPPKQSMVYESHRIYNSEMKPARRPLAEKDIPSSHSSQIKQHNSLKPGCSKIEILSSQTTQEEKREESNTKRAIFPMEPETKENQGPANAIEQPKLKLNEHLVGMKTPLPHVVATNLLPPAVERLSIMAPNSTVQNKMEKPQNINESQPKIQCVIPRRTEIIKNVKLKVKGREYMILNVIGRGMSAEVLQVQDVETQELRAIKRVNLNSMDKECIRGCIDEINMLYKLQASCIVRMFDYEIKQPYLFVVMELGETDLSSLLKTVIHEQKKLPYIMVLHYWMEMLSAVKYIHDNGVIHSDLKPANFILVKGRLKLIDFGIASSITADSTSVVKELQTGTLNYISPEALLDANAHSDSATSRGKYKISRKSDVWSLGCILYCLVYGVTPFQHIRNQWAKINAIISTKPAIAYPIKRDDNGENIPPILIDVIQKCLQHDPKTRPSVDDLLKVSYITSNKPQDSMINIQHSTLLKIKNVLSEDEWREFIQALSKSQ